MMEKWIAFMHAHANHAHWFIFGGALLAGLNIPISIDLLMILSATMAGAVVPEKTILLFFSIYLGCLFSAYLSYWLGRIVGPRVLKWPLINKLLSPKRLAKIKKFYEKRGPYAFIIGRFIPFGVRNGLYLSSGISRMSFPKFVLWDGIGCTLWSVGSFFLYYLLGKNLEHLYSHVKFANLLIFIAFSVTVIGVIWYKKKKYAKEGNV